MAIQMYGPGDELSCHSPSLRKCLKILRFRFDNILMLSEYCAVRSLCSGPVVA